MLDNKKPASKSFLIQTAVIAVLLMTLHFVLKSVLPELPFSPARTWLILFFFAITNLIYYYQRKATLNKGSKSVNIFIVTTGFKLLFFLAIIVIYALIMRDDAVRFITDFFILYLIFTTVEVIRIKQFLNSQSEEHQH